MSSIQNSSPTEKPLPAITAQNQDSDDEEEFDFIESRWENGVETGLTIAWPTSKQRSLELSTKLKEELIAPLFDGTQWAGTRVWKAAVVALEYLLQEYPIQDASTGIPCATRSLLELGCGLGVPAMLWHLLQESPADSTSADPSIPGRVVLTDMPDLLPQLEANVRTNFEPFYGKTIEAKALSWSKDGIRDLLREERSKHRSKSPVDDKPVFDICLNCDCIYEPLYGRDSWEALADVLAEVAKESPSTILVTSVERRNGDGLENFLERLEKTGTVELPIRRVLRNEEDKHHVIEIYVTKGKEATPSAT